MTVKVLFVCLGNICRSPTAHALFQAAVNKAQLDETIIVDSAGTGGWHAGAAPDKRAQKVALEYGYDMSHLQARQVCPNDFESFDYILCMDHENLANLKAIKPHHYRGVLGLFLPESGNIDEQEVPDPYYGDEQHFHHVMNLIEQAVAGLLARIKRDHHFLAE